MTDDAYERLHDNYRKSFKSKEQQLIELSFNADKDTESLRTALHKIAGSSGLYGYDDLHELSLDAERADDIDLVGKTQLVINWLRNHLRNDGR